MGKRLFKNKHSSLLHVSRYVWEKDEVKAIGDEEVKKLESQGFFPCDRLEEVRSGGVKADQRVKNDVPEDREVEEAVSLGDKGKDQEKE